MICWYHRFSLHNVFVFWKLLSFKRLVCWLDSVIVGSFCETNNTDRNGVNKQNTHIYQTHKKITLERVSQYEKKWYSAFLKKPLFYQSLPGYWKNMNSSFCENFENSTPPPPYPPTRTLTLYKGGGSHYEEFCFSLNFRL